MNEDNLLKIEKYLKTGKIAEWKSSQIHWSHKPVREVRGCKSHFRNYKEANSKFL